MDAEDRAKAEAMKKEAQAKAKLLADAESLMRANRPGEAYDLLQSHEFERSGEIRFDYLLGISALDSGKPDKATLAFERVLAVDPNFAGARLDMARAYFQMGDLVRARTEFDAVMKQDPPPAARITIEKYLAAIGERENAQKTSFHGYLEAIAGHDSNVNSATSQAHVPVPAFGNLVFTLDSTSQKTPDNYATGAGGLDFNRMLTPKLGIFAGADGKMRRYAQHNAFAYLDLAMQAGASYNHEGEIFRLGWAGSHYRLGSRYSANRNGNGITADWMHPVGESDRFTAFTQYSQNRFVASSLKVQDFDFFLLGGNWLHLLDDGKYALYGSVYGGRESGVAPVSALNPGGGRPDGDKSLAGIRGGAQLTLSDKWECFTSIGAQSGKYNKENLAFLVNRSDTTMDWSAGLSWRPFKDWIVRPQLSWSRNNSNISIYSYNRTDLSVAVRWNYM